MATNTAKNLDQETGWTRRNFLITTVSSLGGLCLGFSLSKQGLLDNASAAGDVQINAYIRIGADNRVTILFGGCEFGQGSMTGLAQIVAEELMAKWEQVTVTQIRCFRRRHRTRGKLSDRHRSLHSQTSVDRLSDRRQQRNARPLQRFARGRRYGSTNVDQCRCSSHGRCAEPVQRCRGHGGRKRNFDFQNLRRARQPRDQRKLLSRQRNFDRPRKFSFDR